MIVEVFCKGTNFEKIYGTLWNVKAIRKSGGLIIINFEDGEETSFDSDKYELRVTY